MYIAMNRFKIVSGKEDEFEAIWKNRDSHLKDVKGFVKFNLLKSKTYDEYTLFASHSVWDSAEHFVNWTKSDAFRLAHKNSGSAKGVYMGHPEFEGFEVVI
tara:strand:+ start:116 stop:418 length:303 start_codon:yes stop_codon:yes gene_type:complete